MNYADLVTGTVAVLLGLVAIFTVYQARRKYYGGPWKAVVVWMMWGVAISLSRLILIYVELIVTPEMVIPDWALFLLYILSFFCFMEAAFAIRNIADFYSSPRHKGLTEENESKRRKMGRGQLR